MCSKQMKHCSSLWRKVNSHKSRNNAFFFCMENVYNIFTLIFTEENWDSVTALYVKLLIVEMVLKEIIAIY